MLALLDMFELILLVEKVKCLLKKELSRLYIFYSVSLREVVGSLDLTVKEAHFIRLGTEALQNSPDINFEMNYKKRETKDFF